MALIKCRDCGGEVSKKAKACRRCGRPVRNAAREIRNAGFWIAVIGALFARWGPSDLAGVALLALIGGCGAALFAHILYDSQ